MWEWPSSCLPQDILRTPAKGRRGIANLSVSKNSARVDLEILGMISCVLPGGLPMIGENAGTASTQVASRRAPVLPVCCRLRRRIGPEKDTRELHHESRTGANEGAGTGIASSDATTEAL